MGTQLGNVTRIYGQKHNTTVTNLNGETIMNSAYLKENTFIVSAPQTINKEDIGTYSLFMTDSEGRPVRLSYTIQPGNGLVIGRNGEPVEHGDSLDIISMAIDNHSIKADDPTYQGAIYVKKENIIDNNTLMVVTPSDKPSCIKVITENLDHAGNTTSGFGIAQGDGNTITTYDGYLTVQTRNLDYADDETDTHGIIDANTNPYRTVRSDNGILSVWTQNLDRAAVDSLGVVKPDGTYTFTDDEGTFTVSNFVYTYSYLGERTVVIDDEETTEQYRWDEHGIVVPDLVTLGTYEAGEMHVITDGLDKASEEQYGVVKPDGISTGVNTYGLLEVKQYAKLQAIMDVFDSRYTYILNKLNELEGRIVILETTSSTENIELDIDNSMLTILSKPTWDAVNGVVVSPMENVSVELRVATNCKFKVSVEYENNINPGIVLTQLKLGSDIVVTAAGLQDYEFDSTDETINQLKLTFECSNYTATTNDSEISTVATIKITSMNDASVYKKAVHTFVRHNTSKYVQQTPIEPPVIPTPEPKFTPGVPAYVRTMFAETSEYSRSVSRFETSSTLVKFNILGPYYSFKRAKIDTRAGSILGNISRPNRGIETNINLPAVTLSNMNFNNTNNISNIVIEDEVYTADKDILPTLTKQSQIGFLDVNVEYFRRKTIDSIPVRVINSRDWLKYKLETTYTVCHSNDYSYNMIRLYSIDGLDYKDPYRTAKITFTYFTNNERTETSTYTIIYNENYEEKRPTLRLTATLSNSSPFINIVATKSNGALMIPDENNNWSVLVNMKYVKADGTFVNPSLDYDLQYTLSGSVDNDTISYNVTTKPGTLSNIAGCKIVSAETNSFQYNVEGHEGPEISFVTRNVWNKPISRKTYSFGNASITKMRINKWDDLELKIQFDIVPGPTTNINVGATINELLSTSDGEQTFRFFKGSSSYDWKKYYDTCTFSASTWDTFGTTVTFRFTNTIDLKSNSALGNVKSLGTPVTSNKNIQDQQILSFAKFNTDTNKYETISSPLAHVYKADIVEGAISNKNRAVPALDYFGHIRFWFALSATFEDNTTLTNFEVSTNGLSDKIGNGGQCYKYNQSIETPVTIINGYYKDLISTKNISETKNVIAETKAFVESVSELTTALNELKTTESAILTTNTITKNPTNATGLALMETVTENLSALTTVNAKTLGDTINALNKATTNLANTTKSGKSVTTKSGTSVTTKSGKSATTSSSKTIIKH